MSSFFNHRSLSAAVVCSQCGRSHKQGLNPAPCPNCYHSPVGGSQPLVPVSLPPGASFVSGHGGGCPPSGVFAILPNALFQANGLWVPLGLLLIAAGLVFFNAVALLSPGFVSAWTAVFSWVGLLGSLAFILGVILSIVIFGAFLLIFLGFRVLGAFIVLPTSVLSLLIGGGFVAGVVFGVLGAFLILMNERFRC